MTHNFACFAVDDYGRNLNNLVRKAIKLFGTGGFEIHHTNEVTNRVFPVLQARLRREKNASLSDLPRPLGILWKLFPVFVAKIAL